MGKCSSCGPKRCTCTTRVYSKQGVPGRGIRGKQGKQGIPGTAATSNVTIKYTAFVAKNGNDATALVERLDKPYLTITAATNAIAAAYPARTVDTRVRVIVFDGKYAEDIILKKFVDYDLGNIVLNGQITDNDVDLGATNDGEWTNIFWGNARIYNESAGAIVPRKGNTKILMYCNEVGTASTEAITFINGIMRLHCNRVYTNDTGSSSPAIEMLQGIEVDPIYAYSKLEIIGADIFNAIGAASTIQFNSGTTFKNQTLTLIDCRVRNNNTEVTAAAGKNAISFGTVIGSNGRLVLYNTVLFSLWGNSIYVTAGNTASVCYYHSNMANKAVGGAGTLTNVLSTTLTVNAAVAAEF
jgi:hypothetical protein